MFYIFCIIACFATEVFTSDFSLLDQYYYDLDKAGQTFEQFKTKFGKQYEENNDFHFEVFKQNVQKINEWNRKEGTKMFGINQFTDMSFVEFSKMYLGLRPNVTSNSAIVYKLKAYSAPQSLDWRTYGYVTSVKNQNTCGSCFAFSAIGNIEGVYAKKHNTRAISLSAQQGLDCESQGDCVRGGVIFYVYKALAQQGGSMREEDYPYENQKGQCRTRREKIVVRVTGGDQMMVNGENDLKEALATYGPLSIAVCVDDQFQSYRGGVFRPYSPCTQYNHGVLLVGYGNDGREDYWLIKNSWDTTWGEQGYIRIVRGQKACSIGDFVACSTVE